MNTLKAILLCVSCCFVCTEQSYAKNIRINQVNGAKQQLVFDILKLAVSKASSNVSVGWILKAYSEHSKQNACGKE